MKTKKNTIQHIAIVIVVISLIVITAMFINSNIDFVSLVMKIHGG